MFRRFSCLSLACAILFCVSAPASATGMEMGGAGGIGIPIIGNVNLDVVDFFDYVESIGTEVWNSFRHKLHEDVCPCAPQLNGGHKFQPVRTLRDGQVGLYYQCEYCGQSYGEALEEAYQEYVETLPSPQYNSSGAFLWVPGADDFPSGIKVTFRFRGRLPSGHDTDRSFVLSLPNASGIVSGESGASIAAYVGDYLLCSPGALDIGSRSSDGIQANWLQLRLPVAGLYTVVDGAFGSVSGNGIVGYSYNAGDVLSVGVSQFYSQPAGAIRIPWPSFWVELYTGGSGGNTYDFITRVCGSVDSNQGLYGYVEDGQLYQSTVGTIYNETSNVYQNPVTGDVSNVESWTYDYGDRSYALTTDEGDEITVTYGDSVVTINEGGTTYNVYYLMEETEDIQQELESYCDHDYSSVLVTAPTCTTSGVRTYTCSKCGASYTQTVPPTGHDYASAVTMAPTCVNTGVRTFTCNNCGDSYTVSIASTGHTWQVVSSVPTTFDNETGQLVQAGYTLYQCATCGEQYKIEADSGGSSLPVPSSGGASTDTGELMSVDGHVGKGFLATVARGLTEDLPEAIRAASSWFTELPKLYEGYIGFLGASISWLPSDIQALFRFSVGFVTFVGIIRKIWARG